MPLYEYECPNCGATAELRQPMNSDAGVRCTCGHWMVRQISRPSRAVVKDGTPIHHGGEK